MKIVFTTDLHGEIWKYDRLLKAARDFRAAVVINGGEMLPKSGNLLEDQGKFITGYLDGIKDSAISFHPRRIFQHLLKGLSIVKSILDIYPVLE